MMWLISRNFYGSKETEELRVSSHFSPRGPLRRATLAGHRDKVLCDPLSLAEPQ